MKKDLIKPIKRPSLRDEIYQVLKKSITTLELQPNERLSDKELAEKFGTSRTPVREALKRLEDEGLVQSLPNSATFVAPLDIREAIHAFTVVAALHALAARLANPLMNDTDVELLIAANRELKLAIEKGDVVAAIEADTRFHNVFLVKARNPEISMALERCVPKLHRLEISQFNTLDGLQSVEQHHHIISALTSQEYDTAVRLVEANWLSLGERLTHEAKAWGRS